MRATLVLALAGASLSCSGGNGKAGLFYGQWSLVGATNADSCAGTSTQTGTMSVLTGGGSADLSVQLRNWPPCTINGIGLDVDDMTATGNLMCSATTTGSDGSASSVAVDIENLTLMLDSNEDDDFLTLSGMQTDTDATGSACDITLAGSASKIGATTD